MRRPALLLATIVGAASCGGSSNTCNPGWSHCEGSSQHTCNSEGTGYSRRFVTGTVVPALKIDGFNFSGVSAL